MCKVNFSVNYKKIILQQSTSFMDGIDESKAEMQINASSVALLKLIDIDIQ